VFQSFIRRRGERSVEELLRALYHSGHTLSAALEEYAASLRSEIQNVQRQQSIWFESS